MYGKVNDELVWIGYDDQQSFVEKVLVYFFIRMSAGASATWWCLFIYLFPRRNRTCYPPLVFRQVDMSFFLLSSRLDVDPAKLTER